ncbi:MAG: hypothetical protein WDN45_04540 [Caulobacteraceae bacterium]
MPELDIDAEDDKPDAYDPSELEATRAREQGLGVGERDLQRQRDAQRPAAPADEEAEE